MWMRLDEQAGDANSAPRRAAPEQDKNTRKAPQSRGNSRQNNASSGNSAMSDALAAAFGKKR